ncbi:MAG: 1-phosphofructokinase [Chloroflexi bacterium HGW-Chloroflexi-3]|nr:MAG: 1-phosphofructokinase [Chloroflexi bacterium HGW-Chloroflexi-3]
MIYTLTLNPAIDKEFLVPTIEVDQVLRAQSVQLDFGGKGFNVSRMLKSLGRSSTALGFVGGNAGEVLQNGLIQLGIDTDFVVVGGETRTNISIVPADRGHYIKVNEPGPIIQDFEVGWLNQKIKSLLRPDDWWVLAGSLPLGLSESCYADLIVLIQSKGAHTVLDTSGDALRYGCEKEAFLVKPNVIEAEKITGIAIKNLSDAQTCAQMIVSFGPQNVVLSLGEQGALWATADETWLAISPPIVEHNPIGAGDSLVGGIVWGLSQNLPIQECLCWGVACGSAAASLDGTAVGSYDYVYGLKQKTRIKQL